MDLQAEATDVLATLIRFDTVNPPGNERACQEWLKRYLEDAGVECELLCAEDPERPNLVARLGGDADGPALGYLSHVDTVLADAADWRHDPWSGEIHDGALWGRGAVDMKSQTAAEAVAVAHLARNGWRPPRGELKLIAVVDEETGGRLGAQWLTEQRPDAVRVDWLLNEGAGGVMLYGDRRLYGVCCAEEGTFRFRVSARRRAGRLRRGRRAARVPAVDRRGPRRPRGRSRAHARDRAAARRAARADARRHVRADADLGRREDQRDPGAGRVRGRLPAAAGARPRRRRAPRARADRDDRRARARVHRAGRRQPLAGRVAADGRDRRLDPRVRPGRRGGAGRAARVHGLALVPRGVPALRRLRLLPPAPPGPLRVVAADAFRRRAPRRARYRLRHPVLRRPAEEAVLSDHSR